MSDIEYEMNKYTKLITKKVYNITNSINNLKELYKTKNILLNQKRPFCEIEINDKKEKEKTNCLKINNNNFSHDNNLNLLNDINSNLNNNEDNNNIKNNEETILKRGLIKTKIIIQPKYNSQEGIIKNGFQIVIYYSDFKYYLGPFDSKNFTYNLNYVIINKLDEVSNKWGYCTKLSYFQKKSLFNCFNQVEITINNFFRDNNNIIRFNDDNK